MNFIENYVDLSKFVSNDYITLSKSDAKGRYLKAAKDIPAGTCILNEKAAFSINNELKEHLIVELKLPEMSVSRIFVGAMYDFIDLDKRLASLCFSQECLCEEELELMQMLEQKNPGLLKRYLILVHNSFEIENPPTKTEKETSSTISATGPVFPTTSALYFIASFFNHSCDPNCSYSFDMKTASISIFTNTTVTVGEELTIGYCLIPEPDEDEDEDEEEVRFKTSGSKSSELSKGELFRRKYGFPCYCSTCTTTEKHSLSSLSKG